ncbi:hypothetical protein Tco_0141069 [Tanacetum coccineum]
MRKMVMMRKMKVIEDLNNEKDERKWQSMVLEMKIEEIVCSKREIPARIEGCSSHNFHEEGFDGLWNQHSMKKRYVKNEMKNWSETIHHHYHQSWHQFREARKVDFKWWKRN